MRRVIQKVNGGWLLPIGDTIVDRCAIDYAFALEFHVGTETLVLRIESDFTLNVGGQECRFAASEPRGLGPAIALFGQSVSSAYASEDGSLVVMFEDGRILMVPSNLEFEAWEFFSSDGMRLVCGPGGTVSVWQTKLDSETQD